MINNIEKENSQNNISTIKKIANIEKTQSNLYAQISVIRKIIHSICWGKSIHFTDAINYEISKFVYNNPIQFITPIYKHVDSKKLKLDCKKSYILVNSTFRKNVQNKQKMKNQVIFISRQKVKQNKKMVNIQVENQKLKTVKQGQYAINIKVIKYWKSCKINNQNTSYKQIINKSKYFIDFIKNIKIDNPKQQTQNNEIKNYQSSNIQDKQSKLYTLVCQRYDYILSKITEIQLNQKYKKFDHSIAKTYIEMMNKNIIVLNVEKNNFNPISYKSEGKFIYFQNTLKLPLISQRFNRIYSHLESFKIQPHLQKFIPYLQCTNDNEWYIKNSYKQNVQLFQQNQKQKARNQGIIIDRYLNLFKYDDYLISQ